MNKFLHLLKAGIKIKNDWADFPVPVNMEVGTNTVIDSSYCFRRYFSKLPIGLKIGSNVTIETADLATAENGYIEIGDYSYLAKASIVASSRIIIGKHVHLSLGVTIVDSDFHPLDAGQRMKDTIASSTIGDRTKRPTFESKAVIIEDDVWVGFNATILKGVTIGRGSIIHPGSVVSKNVPAESEVFGNPGTIMPLQHV